jgi:hypothetical protein
MTANLKEYQTLGSNASEPVSVLSQRFQVQIVLSDVIGPVRPKHHKLVIRSRSKARAGFSARRSGKCRKAKLVLATQISRQFHSARQLCQEIVDRQRLDAIDSLTALTQEDDYPPGQFASALRQRFEPFQIARLDPTRGFDLDRPQL